jgi:3-oxoacyl-[acyl-carrier-protein] synthase III
MSQQTQSETSPLSITIDTVAQVLHSLTEQARDIRLASEILHHHHDARVTNNNNNSPDIHKDNITPNNNSNNNNNILMRQLEKHVVAVEEQMKILTKAIEQEQRALDDISTGIISQTIIEQRERIRNCCQQVGKCSNIENMLAAGMEVTNTKPQAVDISPCLEKGEKVTVDD